MKITKAKLQARLQKKLDKLVAEKVAYINNFIPYRDAVIKWDEQYIAALKASKSDADFAEHERRLGPRPYRHDFGKNPSHYDNERRTKRVLRNMAMLDAIEEDVIEIESLKLSKNFGFDSIFDED